MNRDVLRQIAVVVSVLATIVFNGLANALPLNGLNTGEISDRFAVYFVPAGYVFAIWGLIYIGWLAFAVYQALPAQRANPRLRKAGWLFAASGVANMAWLACWHYEQFVLSVVVMLALLGLLIAVYLRLDIGRAAVSRVEGWCVDVPMSVYLGWISVATIANITSALYFLEWGGAGIAPQVWAVIMLAVGTALTAAMVWRRGEVAFALVALWAFAGIANKQAAVPLVAGAAWMACGLVALALAAGFRRGRAPVSG